MEFILRMIQFINIVLMAYALKYTWDLYRVINELSRTISAHAEVEPVSGPNEEV